MKNLSDTLNILTWCAAILTILGLILAVPFALVWSLNTLFPILSIPYNFKTWLASLILMAIIKSRSIDTAQKK